MDSLVKSNRDLIKLKNGYYKYTLNATYEPAGGLAGGDVPASFQFNLPPMNSMGFSDHYNQALVKIQSVEVFNRLGVNQVWGTAGGDVRVLPATFNVNIPCPNNIRIGDYTLGTFANTHRINQSGLHAPLKRSNAAAGFFTTTTKDGLSVAQQLGSREIGLYSQTYGRQAVGGVNTTQPSTAANTTTINNAVTTISASALQENVSYTFEDHSSIFETGLLCGNPCGTTIDCNIICPFETSQTPVGLHTPTLDQEDGNTTMIRLCLEVQVLPNPTSRD